MNTIKERQESKDKEGKTIKKRQEKKGKKETTRK